VTREARTSAAAMKVGAGREVGAPRARMCAAVTS
jgi:hypothetical protein